MRRLPADTRIAVRLTHYCPELGFIYHHNAKAASTTTTRLLHELLSRRRAVEGTGSLLSGPAHWREIIPVLNDPATYRFTFVRHPVARAVSTFNNFFVEQQNAYTRRYRFATRRAGIRLGDASHGNFDRFLDLSEELLTEHPDICDLHIRTQVRNLFIDDLRYRRIGRMETFAADMAKILGDIGLAQWSEESLFDVRENASRSVARFRHPSQRQVDRLLRLYAEDFDLFGYEGDRYLARPRELSTASS